MTQHSHRRPSTRRAVATLLVAATAVVVATSSPADAALPWWRRSTTTTTQATTTTTQATTTTTQGTTTTLAPTTTTTAPPATGCATQQVLKPDGTPWVCTWSDEFDGTTLDRSKWFPQQTATSGFTSGVECFMDSPSNVSVGGGMLSLTVRKEAAPFTCADPLHGSFTTSYTGGMVSTYTKFSQTYGRFEVRAKFPAVTVAGLQEALWLWPENPVKYGAWPWSGEIDIAEIYTRYNDRAIPYIHYVPNKVDVNVTNNYCLIDDVSKMHSYVAEWTPSYIRISYDGKVCITDVWSPLNLTFPKPFDSPFIVALTQGLGVTGNAFDPATTPLPATTQVDYVRVWK